MTENSYKQLPKPPVDQAYDYGNIKSYAQDISLYASQILEGCQALSSQVDSSYNAKLQKFESDLYSNAANLWYLLVETGDIVRLVQPNAAS